MVDALDGLMVHVVRLASVLPRRAGRMVEWCNGPPLLALAIAHPTQALVCLPARKP